MMKIRLTALLLCLLLLFTGCSVANNNDEIQDNQSNKGNPNSSEAETQGATADLGDDNKTFGESLDNLGVGIGIFHLKASCSHFYYSFL